MANQVMLTFAGDSSDLERSMDRVGGAARRMDTEASSSFDRVGESADNLDTRAMGFRDTITGVQDTFRGLTDDSLSLGDRLLMLGMGIGDLASGVANFGVQFAKQAASFVANSARMVASSIATTATVVAGWVAKGAAATVAGVKMAAAWLIGLGPVGLVIAAIGAIIAILALLGVDFDDVKRIAGAAWDWIWQKAEQAGAIIRNVFTGVRDWVGGVVSGIVGFFTGLPGRITSIFSGLGSAVANGFRSVWNNTIGGFGFTVPSWVPLVGGRDFRIPRLHTGGVVPGVPGQEVLTILQAGEVVTPASRAAGAGSGPVINFYGPVLANPRDVGREVTRALREFGRAA